mmetsp:Transcript_13566/g.37204  ORF Transcript_13566/g.37204 Transcript_13566/m.37204 type:complete len:265 (+) Transcript_13566:245-1039(+)
MMAMRSPKMSASSMKCVVRTVTRPSRTPWMMFQVDRRLKGSMPEVGSSRKETRGRLIRAMHSESFRFWPPDREPARVIHFSASPTSCIISLARFSTSRAGTPRSKAKVRRCSITVSSDHNTSCCGQTPMRRRISVMSVRIEWPAIVASPALGVTMPVSMLMVVDFPAPLWPSKAKISPSYIVNWRSSTATFLPPGVENSRRKCSHTTKVPVPVERALTASPTCSTESGSTHIAEASERKRSLAAGCPASRLGACPNQYVGCKGK